MQSLFLGMDLYFESIELWSVAPRQLLAPSRAAIVASTDWLRAS